MQTENNTSVEAPQPEPEPQQPGLGSRFRRPRFLFRDRQNENSGQAIVEFAIVSIAFFMLVFGSIDFGRAIYMYSQLHNAVQEGARLGKSNPTKHDQIANEVIADATSFNLTADDIVVTCYKTDGTETADCATCSKVQVAATAEFKAITQEFLGISSVDLHAVSRVATE